MASQIYHKRADNSEPEFEGLHIELLLEEVLEGFELKEQDWDLVGVLLHGPRERGHLVGLTVLEKLLPENQKTGKN